MWNNSPIDFGQQMVMEHFQMVPQEVKGRYNQAVETEKRYLYTKLYSVFDFTLPKEWPTNLFRLLLFHYGSIASVYTAQFGWIFWTYGVTKVGLYYLPSEIEVWNGHLKKAARGVLGVNAEIIRCMDDYGPVDDLITKYAVKLANLDKSIDVNLMNCNVSLYAEAKNKKDADDIYEAYGKATSGSPMVVLNKNLIDGGQLKSLIESPKTNFMGLEMLQARQEIVNMFLTDIGIPTANYDKRAQMSTGEVQQRDGERKALVSVMRDNIQECFERLNAISGLGLSVRLNKETTGGASDGKTDPMGNAAVQS